MAYHYWRHARRDAVYNEMRIHTTREQSSTQTRSYLISWYSSLLHSLVYKSEPCCWLCGSLMHVWIARQHASHHHQCFRVCFMSLNSCIWFIQAADLVLKKSHSASSHSSYFTANRLLQRVDNSCLLFDCEGTTSIFNCMFNDFSIYIGSIDMESSGNLLSPCIYYSLNNKPWETITIKLGAYW